MILKINPLLTPTKKRKEMKTQWIDITKQLPPPGLCSVIVYGSYTRDCPKKPMEVHYRLKGRFCEFRSMDGIKTKNVTHWMTMPEPPAADALINALNKTEG